MLFNQILRSISRATGRQVANIFGGWATEAANSELAVSLTYGVTVAVNASRGNVQSLAVTDGVAYTISSPTNPPATGYGQLLAFIIVNAGVVASGLGAFGAGYTDTGDVPVLQPGERVVITFRWNGMTWLELSRSSSAAADALQVRRQVTQLTDAQIKAMPTTFPVITPTPAIGKIFLPVFLTVRIDSTAGAYTNVDTSDAYIEAAPPDFSASLARGVVNDTTPLTEVTTLLGGNGAGNHIAQFNCPFLDGTVFPTLASNLSGQPIVLATFNDAAGNFTGGNAANSGEVTCLYVEVNAS